MPAHTYNSPTPFSHHRFHLLDGLRGLAAIMVVIYHAPSYFGTFYVLPNAFLAVDFFYCLSGFVIAFSYEQRLLDSMRWHQFAITRLIRLYPLYLAALIAGFVTITLDIGLRNAYLDRNDLLLILARNALFLPLTSPPGGLFAFPFDPPSWSVSYEIVAGLILAALIVKRLAHNLFLLIVAALSLIALARLGSGLNIGWSIGQMQIVYGWARIGLSFSLGVLVCRLWRVLPLPALHHWLPAVLLGACLVLLLIPPVVWLTSPAAQLIIATLAMPLIVYGAANVRLGPSWTTACIVSGEISYPLYLLHDRLFHLLNNIWAQHLIQSSRVPLPIVLIALVAALCAIAYAAAKRYDAPVRKALTGLLLGPPHHPHQTAT